MGHKSTYCQEDKIDQAELMRIVDAANLGGNERVNCFSCGQNGHYANICPYKKKPAEQPNEQQVNEVEGQTLNASGAPAKLEQNQALLNGVGQQGQQAAAQMQNKRKPVGLSQELESAVKRIERGQQKENE